MTKTRQMLLALGLAVATAVPALLATSIAVPATAQQISVSISFDNFHNRLAPYGTWSNHSRWGEVWRPRADQGFRPYYKGYWANTREYGWLWVSNDSWGDIPYHYGRWVYDPFDGWLWVPGFVWGPSWVVWREGGGNIGWFPMPPDDYYGNGPYGGNFNNQYGYRDWYGPSFGNDTFLSLWIFVGMDRFGDRDYRNYVRPPRDYGSIIVQTNDITNYITVNNYVVNRSINENRLPRERAQRFQPVPASSVIARDALVTPADVGRQVEQRERQRRPIPANINPAEQRGRLGDREPATKGVVQPTPQTGRDASGPATDTERQKGQAQPERRDRDAAVPTTRAAPTEKRGTQGDPQTERGKGSSQAPQTRGGQAQDGKVIVQESRTPPRVQGTAPTDERQGKETNRSRTDRQGDAKKTDEEADDKKSRADGGRN